ncbi:MAG: hypothetical protein DKM50_02785 [Candidatus Margulisiibacteriota bacterium]|nr:MAG: hypothetical protein DKM50_02785 [Candidatus Margulisiibacteriota bacterium]HCY37390.1 hypothetical protein [Candidatus Margulisiibacteriota bacterium]
MDFLKDHLLLVEYLILIGVALGYWLLETKSKIFDKILNVLMLVLVAGIPIIYSSITRSVFEVNKLLLLRLVLSFGYGLWLTKCILLSTQHKKTEETTERKKTTNVLGISLAVSTIVLISILPVTLPWKIFTLVIAILTIYLIPSIGFQWKWMRLENAFLAWLLVNIFATIISKNMYVSIIGAYDRWEGIITVFNYIMLLLMFAQLVRTRRALYWLLGGLLVPTTLSAIYGIFQSFGVDFMHWSVDPTSRVFASINNPVHFSAYVGMLVPVGLGFLLHLWSLSANDKDLSNKYSVLKWVIYISTFLCYYALYLSFSRAATLGFTASMTIFYLFSLDLFSKKSKKTFILDFFLTGGFIALFYIDYIFLYFMHESLGKYVLAATGLYFICYFVYQLVYMAEERSPIAIVRSLLANLLLLTVFFFDDRFSFLKDHWWGFVAIAGLLSVIGYYLFSMTRKKGFDGVRLSSKILIVYMFAKLQFVVSSWAAIGIYIVLLFVIYILVQEKDNLNKTFFKAILKLFAIIIAIPTVICLLFDRTMIDQFVSPELGILIMNFIFLTAVSIYLFVIGKENIKQEKINMLVSFMLLFAVIVFVPSFSNKITELFQQKDSSKFSAALQAAGKVGSYGTVALEGTARTSMWKSSLPWIKDNMFLGTGPDTVKEMYPKYRRADYGILEGGHNFTPDRVHNEYLNTAITTGLIGFAVRWFWLIGGFFVISLGFLYKNQNKPLFYILIGTMSGAMVHLGQLNFNFSVVATAVLFYSLIGLSLAIGYFNLGNPEEKLEEVPAEIDNKRKSKSKKELRMSNPFFDEPFDDTKVDSSAWVKITLLWIVVGVFVWQAFCPYLAERYYREGFNYSSQKRRDLSIVELAKACNYAPWETQYRVQLGKDYEEMAGDLTNIPEKLAAYKKAELEYDNILRISPLNPWYINRLANVFLQYQNLYSDPKMKADYLNKAETLLHSAATIDNNDPLFHMSYGFFMHKLGKVDVAMKEYEKVLAIDGRMSEARYNMADIYRMRGDVTRAIQEYEYIATSDPTFTSIYDSLGRIYFSRQEFNKAVFVFEKALIQNPTDINLLRNLGATYHQLQNWDKAVGVYKQALRSNPQDVMIRRYLAQAYYNKGDIELALAQLEEIQRIAPDDQAVIQNINAMRYQLQRGQAKK